METCIIWILWYFFASLKGILVEHEGLTRILKHFNLTLCFRSANILWHKKVEVNELKYFPF